MASNQPPNQQEWAYSIAYAAIAAVVVGFISSAIANKRSREWKHTFCSLILISLVVVQFIYVGKVAVKLPPAIQLEAIRSDCRVSTKGGKLSGSFRDCTEGQPSTCSKENPCTPCDYPVAPFDFDGRLWNSMCHACSKTEDSSCRETSYCFDREDSTKRTQPCKSCCFKQDKELVSVDFGANNCEFVYDQTKGLLGNFTCEDPTYPIKTRYGCCPPEAERKSNSTVLLGNGERVSECLFMGPHGASWAICRNEPGCPLYSNGIKQVGDYCITPS